MREIVLFLLALCPIIWLIVALSGLKMAGHKACLIGLAISLILAFAVWKQRVPDILTGGLEGAAMALWPIILVIVAAVFTYNLVVHTGKMETIKSMLTGVTADRRILVLIIAWGFGGFLEAMAGFGTAVAIPASMLWALGFDPMFAATVCLIADTTPVAFGSIGIPTTTLGQVTGLSTASLAHAAALQLFPLTILIPFVLVAMTGKYAKSPRPFEGIGLVTLISGLSFGLPQLLLAQFGGPELPALIGSVCSMGCTVACVKVMGRKAEAAAFTARAVPAGAGNLSGAVSVPVPPSAGAPAGRGEERKIGGPEALVAWLPFLLIFVFLFLTSLVPPLHKVLAGIKTSVLIYQGAGGTPYTFTWVATPGVLILVAAFLGGAAQGAGFGEMLSVLGRTVVQMSRTIVTVVSVLAMAKVMGYSGMITVIATMLVALTGAFYPLVSPLIGSLGTFITGSATSSSVLFGKLQSVAAGAIHADPVWVAASNVSGATIGKIISPQNIATGAAATSLLGKEGKLLNGVLKYYIVFIVLLGLITFFCAGLFSGLL